jgi:hypothetical protein
MAGFSGAFRTSVGRDDFLRSAEDEAYTQSIIARLMGTDWFSRNDNVRLGGLRTASALGGLPDRDSLNLGDVIRNEDIRRSARTRYLYSSFFAWPSKLSEGES